MPVVYLNKEKKIAARLATYVYGELRARHLTQKSLAEYMGISQQALSAKLNARSFSFIDFINILEYFDPEESEILRLVGSDE